jgi:hypothetical protein
LKDFKFDYENARKLLKSKNQQIEKKYNIKKFIGLTKM